jgi:hypothetical protein
MMLSCANGLAVQLRAQGLARPLALSQPELRVE